jgi:hypothetical protein
MAPMPIRACRYRQKLPGRQKSPPDADDEPQNSAEIGHRPPERILRNMSRASGDGAEIADPRDAGWSMKIHGLPPPPIQVPTPQARAPKTGDSHMLGNFNVLPPVAPSASVASVGSGAADSRSKSSASSSADRAGGATQTPTTRSPSETLTDLARPEIDLSAPYVPGVFLNIVA